MKELKEWPLIDEGKKRYGDVEMIDTRLLRFHGKLQLK
jgi:hypothetical protein